MVSNLEHLQKYWYVGGLSETLKNEPLARTIAGVPIVLFRDAQGSAQALLDRCCHRYLPLSMGKVTANGIQCGYHGWEFAPGGKCVRIPGRSPDATEPNRGCVDSFAVVETDGLVWVYPTPNVKPPVPPFPIQHAEDSEYRAIRIDFGSMEAPFENVVDNFMDSLHPPFVHAGLIYDDKKRNRIEIEVRPYQHPAGHWGVEGLYLGEPPPTQGLIGRLFAKASTDPSIHEERYVAPSMTQAEYKIGETTHLLSSHLFTPETPTSTRMYLLLRTKSRIPHFMTQPILRALFTKLFRQDIAILQHQHKAMEFPKNLPYVSSELDILSMITLRFLREVADGHPQETIAVKSQRYALHI